MGKAHPFAAKKEVDLAELSNERFIMLPQNTSLQHFIDLLCQKAGFTPHVALICDYTLREEMVIAGYGISITTLRSAEHNTNEVLTYARITNPPDKRILGLAWNKILPFTKAMEQFYHHITRYYAK